MKTSSLLYTQISRHFECFLRPDAKNPQEITLVQGLVAVMLVLLGGMSIWASVVVFGVITTQIIVVGFIASKILPGGRSDFILELPPIRIPKITNLIKTTAWRLWWFTREAVPLFLLATFVLFLLDRIGGLLLLQEGAQPAMTGLLNLPSESVHVVLMAVIRRESGAAMLNEFTDTGVFSNVQAVVCLLLVIFLSPCVNAVFVMIKERGVRGSLGIMGFVTTYAVLVSATVGWLCRVFGVTFE